MYPERQLNVGQKNIFHVKKCHGFNSSSNLWPFSFILNHFEVWTVFVWTETNNIMKVSLGALGDCDISFKMFTKLID